MEKENLGRALDKVMMSKVDEEEIWNNIIKDKVKLSKKHINYKNKTRIVVAASLVVLCMIAISNNSIRAAVNDLGTTIVQLVKSNGSYDIQDIGGSGLKEPLVVTKNDITVTLKQCIFSESEMFLNYYITAENVKNKIESNKMNVSYNMFYDKKDISNNLFKETLSEEEILNNSYDNTRNVMKDKDTVEIISMKTGNDFNYKDKTLKILITVTEGDRIVEFPFEIKVNELYKEKNILLNEKVKQKNGEEIIVTEVTSTFSRVLVTGINSAEKISQIKILNDSGEELGTPSIVIDTENNTTLKFELIRNNLKDGEKYILQIYDTDGELLREMPISFTDK